MRFILITSLLLPTLLFAQYEEVGILWDKSVCYPGDTLWFSAKVMNGNASPSTSLHVDLVNDTGGIVVQSVFVCLKGITIGQLVCPDTPGLYWIRAYTRNGPATITSLTIRGPGNKYIFRRPRVDSVYEVLQGGLLMVDKDTGGYFIKKLNPMVQFYAAAAIDTAHPFHIFTFSDIDTSKYEVDTGFLRYSFVVKGKGAVRGQSVDLILEDGSRTRPPLVAPIDSSHTITIESLNFWDTAYLHYQLNYGKREDVNLSLVPTARPFLRPTDYIDDTILREPAPLPGAKGAKILATVTVKTLWQNRNRWLHKKYVHGIQFMGPSHFNYNLMDSSVTEYTPNIFEYLRRNTLVFSVLHAPPVWYLDGMRCEPEIIKGIPIQELAYFEAIEGNYDEFNAKQPITQMTVWRRKGKDARQVKGQMKYLSLIGYNRMFTWKAPDRTTLSWISFTSAEKQYLQAKPPFQIALMAVVKGRCYFINRTID